MNSSSSSDSSSSSSSSAALASSASSAEEAPSAGVDRSRLARRGLECELFSPRVGTAAARGKAGSFPLFVLLHGAGALGVAALGGAPAALHAHARRLAGEGGCACVVPALASLAAAAAPGASAAQAQLAAVAAVVDLVQHAAAALHAPPCAGAGGGSTRNGGGGALVDARRVFLCGHGAGGALALEVAIELAQAGAPAAGVVMLDALPWPRTVVRAASEFFVDLTLLVSLRAEPGLWNGGGAVLGVLRAPRIAAGSGDTVCDVLVKGARHGDLARPEDALLGCVYALCGLAGPRAGADAADELLLAIALDAGAVSATAPALAQLSRFCGTIDRMESSGVARRGGGGLL